MSTIIEHLDAHLFVSAAGGLKDLPPSPSSCCSVVMQEFKTNLQLRFAPVPVGLLSGKKVILDCGFLLDQPYETAGAALLR